jgi:hypothetical protein
VQLAFNAGWIIAVVVPLAALLASAVCVGAVLATRMVRRRRRARSRSEPGRGRHPGALRGVACT